jgi:hypothetical protein
MKDRNRTGLWALAFTIITVLFTLTVSAQRWAPPPIAQQPFDFNDQFYKVNGVNPEAIVARRTGADGLSVFDKSNDPHRNEVRVIATLPAYDFMGDVMFWYPLGEVYDYGFTDDKAGILAQKIAGLFPIYVFTPPSGLEANVFNETRQAAIIDESWATSVRTKINPLGLREIIRVTYTAKAFTKEGYEMMQYMAKKNGFATDNTPIIKSAEDIEMLRKYEMIALSAPDMVERPRYAIAPLIDDPRNGAIAHDAFLIMATIKGGPLPSEMIFLDQFNCLQKLGNWCQ